MKAPKVAIIGGGIGGFVAAAALDRMGIEVQLFERAGELGEVGAGLQLGPNAVKVLNALGLEQRLLDVAAEPTNMVSVRHDDAALRYREPLKAISQDRYGARYLMAHRADLHRMLVDLVPENRIHVDRNCVEAETRQKGAVARFQDGTEIEADLVIGADGIHSAVRTSIWGKDSPRFTNQICWRAQVPSSEMPERVGPDGSVQIDRDEYVGWLGPNGHVLCYPIRSGQIINIFAGRVSDEWLPESWAVPSSVEEMLNAYTGWNPTLLELFTKVSEVYKGGIFDRDPLKTWFSGRVGLLGDAAHPMMPTLAQGAAMAIEDGFVLARQLARQTDDLPAALRAYDSERRPRASRVQLQARQQFESNQKVPAPPPLSRDWIFEHDATLPPERMPA